MNYEYFTIRYVLLGVLLGIMITAAFYTDINTRCTPNEETIEHLFKKDINTSDYFVDSNESLYYENAFPFNQSDMFKVFYPDSSKKGYIQISPGNNKKYIYLECNNSALVITNTSIYCDAVESGRRRRK